MKRKPASKKKEKGNAKENKITTSKPGTRTAP